MFIVPIQEAKEELEFFSKRISKVLWEEYFQEGSKFSSLFTSDQFEAILAIVDMYSSGLVLELYEHVSTANLPESPTPPEPQAESDEHDPLIP